MKEFKTWVECPIGGMEIYNPKFREATIEQIKESVNFDGEWMPYGYKQYGFCRDTGTVYVWK